MKQWIVNIILFILVLVALGFSLLKVTPFEITSETYIGVIVSLLSLAAAFVIGYQIYNAIEFRKEIKEQREKYNDIIRRNEEIEKKLKQQVCVMQEGFDIISSLMEYNNGQQEVTCKSAFKKLHEALLSSIETDRVDYEWIFEFLRTFISDMCWLSFTHGYNRDKNDEYVVNTPGQNYGRKLKEVIDDYLESIKANDKKLRQSPNFYKIKMEYERTMKLLYQRLTEISENPEKVLTPEEKLNIIYH